jgi:hypothetical protein
VSNFFTFFLEFNLRKRKEKSQRKNVRKIFVEILINEGKRKGIQQLCSVIHHPKEKIWVKAIETMPLFN